MYTLFNKIYYFCIKSFDAILNRKAIWIDFVCRELINDLKELKLKNWKQLIEERKAWNDLVKKTIVDSM
jgi:hypothetical protein